MNVLIIDDEEDICELLEDLCDLNDISSRSISNIDALDLQSLSQVDLIFLDLNMPGKDGIEIINDLSQVKYAGKLVLISGFDAWLLNTAEDIAKDHQLKVVGHFEKPFQMDEIEKLLMALSSAEEQAGDADSESTTSSQANLSLKEVVEAIKQHKLHILYQPQVDMVSHALLGVEALVRLENRQGQLLSPTAFLPLIEQDAIITKLTQSLIEQSFKDMRDLVELFGQMTLAINLSQPDLQQDSFADWAADKANEYGLLPHHIIFEIRPPEQLSLPVIKTLARLRLKGFKLSMDDFGSIANNLAPLKQLPLNEIKIHHSFIREIYDNERAKLILKNTLHLCSELALNVIVSGIENANIEQTLRHLGAEIGQGFFYAEPMAQRPLIDYLQQHSEKVTVDSMMGASAKGAMRVLKTHQPEVPNDAELNVSDQVLKMVLIAPLTGGLSYLGKSQLVGSEMAFAAAKLEHKVDDIHLEVLDDHSSLRDNMTLLQGLKAGKTLAVFGGAIPYPKTPLFAKSLQEVTLPFIAPFNGSVSLHSAELNHVYHLKPSFKDEIEHLAFKVLKNESNVAFVYPEHHLVEEYASVLKQTDTWLHLPYESNNLVSAISQIREQGLCKICFIGSAKGILELMEALDNPDNEYYSISLAGAGLLERLMKRKTTSKLTITSPLITCEQSSVMSNSYHKMLSGLSDYQKTLANSIAFEAFVNTKFILDLCFKHGVTSANQLEERLKHLSSEHLGLGSPVTWSEDKRTLLHKIYQNSL